VSAAVPEGGLAASLRRLADTLLEVAQVRLELLSNEFESEKLRIFDGLVWVVAALMFVTVGMVLAAGFVVLLMPTEWRTATLGGLALLCLVAGAMLGLRARRQLANPAGPIPATVDELKRDRGELSAGE
jgi:uncharacterized membrane protein YqjE